LYLLLLEDQFALDVGDAPVPGQHLGARADEPDRPQLYAHTAPSVRPGPTRCHAKVERTSRGPESNGLLAIRYPLPATGTARHFGGTYQGSGGGTPWVRADR
jgi:hypothetical protein